MPDELDDQDASGLRAQLEASMAKEREASERLAVLERRDAFRDAGLDLTNKQHAAFAKAYDGEFTPDAVKAYVDDLGVTASPPAQPAPTAPAIPAAEQAQLQQIAEAAMSGGTPPPQPDLREKLRQEMEVAARRGNKQELDRISIEYSKAGGFEVRSEH